MKKFQQILTKMNNGQLLSNASEIKEIHNGNDNIIILAIDNVNNKHYFMANYVIDSENDNFSEIENAILNKYYFENKVNPSDAYLILFSKINFPDEDKTNTIINDETNRKIIKLEENDMFFKKYVVSYFEQEYENLEKWVNDNNILSLDRIIEILPNIENDNKALYNILIKILIKIPFWSFSFPSAIMQNYDQLVIDSINNMNHKNKNDVMAINTLINDNMEKNAEELSSLIFDKYMKELC